LWSCMPVIHINQAPACTVGTNKHSHPTPNYGAAAVNRYVFMEIACELRFDGI
jgi:hypothetical protein